VGRPSIPPEQLLRAQLLQLLYSIRSERLLMEEIDYSVLFRWFIGLNLDDEVWDATVFTKNRDRLLEADVAKEFLAHVVEQARGQGLISDEHFTVDGTLLEAWAGAKSFQPKDKKQAPPDDPGNPTVNFRGERRSNETHESKTDPKALGKRSAALELKRQAKLFEPKDGVHDPVVFFHESRIIDLLAVGNGLDQCLEIASLMQKRVRHVATSPETFSVWSICRREKLPAKAFSGPSL
jgi:transposase